jgi:hypothetical protein
VRPCSNETPCLSDGRGAHSPVCLRLVAQGAKPRPQAPRPVRAAAPRPGAVPELVQGGPASFIGCGCGQEWVPDRTTSVVRDGVVHRYGLQCRPAKANP